MFKVAKRDTGGRKKHETRETSNEHDDRKNKGRMKSKFSVHRPRETCRQSDTPQGKDREFILKRETKYKY
jgi:hypothetical protein